MTPAILEKIMGPCGPRSDSLSFGSRACSRNFGQGTRKSWILVCERARGLSPCFPFGPCSAVFRGCGCLWSRSLLSLSRCGGFSCFFGLRFFACFPTPLPVRDFFFLFLGPTKSHTQVERSESARRRAGSREGLNILERFVYHNPA